MTRFNPSNTHLRHTIGKETPVIGINEAVSSMGKNKLKMVITLLAVIKLMSV